MANLFGDFVQRHEALELLAPVRLNTVCFTLSREREQAKVQTFLENINRTGKVFMTATVYKERIGIRAAFVNWRTNAGDVNIAAEVLAKELQKMYS